MSRLKCPELLAVANADSMDIQDTRVDTQEYVAERDKYYLCLLDKLEEELAATKRQMGRPTQEGHGEES